MTHLSMSGSGFAQDSRRNQLRQFAAAAAEAGGNAVAALTNVASGALQSIAPSPQDVAMTDQAVTPPMALRQPALDVARASAITPPALAPHSEPASGLQYSDLFLELQAAAPFFLMAGPNVIQSETHCMKMCRQIKSVTDSLGIRLVFKSSFDKANRTNVSSFRGPGLEEGLRVLRKVKETFGVPIITDIHESSQAAAVAEVADIIQIPAFLCRQTDLLVAAARTGRIIQIKKGQFCAASVMRNSAEKVRAAGNPNVFVCERGTMFGYADLVVDPRNFVWMRDAGCPVTADVTHALQQPAGRSLEGGGVASGGLRELIPTIARTAVAAGVDGLFMEVHDDPTSSPVDGPTQWPLRNFRALLEELIAIAGVTKGRREFVIDLRPVGEEFDPMQS